MLFSTTIGGRDADSVVGLVINSVGDIYIAGTTRSYDFPANAFQTHSNSSNLYRADGAATKAIYSLVGDVLSISPDMQQPGTLWAGTSRGLFRSTDDGVNWTRILNGLPESDGFTVAVDPSNGAILYAATQGKLNDYIRPDRLYKSVDQGNTWTVLPFQSLYGIASLAVDPAQPATVFAGIMYGGARRSTDGGLMWANSAGYPLAFDSRRPGVMSGVDTFNDFARSGDHGANWTVVKSLSAISHLAIDPLRTGVIYAAGSDNARSALFRSVDDGATWTATQVPGSVGDVIADPALPYYYAITSGGIARSTDGFVTWTLDGKLVNPAASGLWLGVSGLTNTPAPTYIGTKFTSDAFVAKLDAAGNLVASTYLGGSDEDSAVALTLDAAGAVYVLGTTFSLDFPGVRPGSQSGYVFVSKLSPNLDRVGDTVRFGMNPPTGLPPEYGDNPTAIAIDALGGIQAGVSHLEVVCQRRDDLHAPECAPIGEWRIYTMDMERAQSPTLTVVGLRPDVIVPSREGAALYIAGGDTIWKRRAGGGLDFATALSGARISSGIADAEGNFIFTGIASCRADFYTSPGVFKRQDPAATSDVHAFLAKLSAVDGSILYSTCAGGESVDNGSAVAVDSAGRVTLAGRTTSHRFPTRSPLLGGFVSSAGYVAQFTAGVTDLVYSTFIGGPQSFEAKSLALDSRGNAIVAGHSYAGKTPLSDVTVIGLGDSVPESTRVDSVVNASSQGAVPLAPGERVTVKTVGNAPISSVLLDGAPLQVVEARENLLTAIMPDRVDEKPDAYVAVEYDDGRVVALKMPTASHSPGVVTVDGSGGGAALVYNEDGTLNSAVNPAPHGSVIAFAINGAGRVVLEGGSARIEHPANVFLNGLYAYGVDAHFGAFPGAPGDVFQVQVRVPYFNQFPYINYRPPLLAELIVEIGGIRSLSGVTVAVKP